MKPFNAVTNSGTRYEFDGHQLRIISKSDGITTFAPRIMRAVPPSALKGHETMAELHQAMRELPETDWPEEGLHLYAAGTDEWRLSTPIAYFG